MTIGIYKITNKMNNKVYIGESVNIEERWEQHRNDLENNNHHSYKLQQDYNEYGADNFRFEIVETIKRNKPVLMKIYLLAYENKYVKQYDSINNGYNIEDTIEKVVKENKPVFQDKPINEVYINTLLYLVEKLEGESLFDKLSKDYQVYKVYNDWCNNKDISAEDLITLIFLYTNYVPEKSMSLCSIQMIIDIMKAGNNAKVVRQIKKSIFALKGKNVIELYDLNNKAIRNIHKDDKIFYVKFTALPEGDCFEISRDNVEKLFSYLDNTKINSYSIFHYFIICKKILHKKNVNINRRLQKIFENYSETARNKIEKYNDILQNDLQLIRFDL